MIWVVVRVFKRGEILVIVKASSTPVLGDSDGCDPVKPCWDVLSGLLWATRLLNTGGTRPQGVVPFCRRTHGPLCVYLGVFMQRLEGRS